MNIEVTTLMNNGCVATPRIGIDGLSPMVAELQNRSLSRPFVPTNVGAAISRPRIIGTIII